MGAGLPGRETQPHVGLANGSRTPTRGAIGRSRGGLTTKLHVAVDALGNPLRVILSAGQIADIDCASALIENLPGQELVPKR